ncbi:MAG: bifunctional DNA primase/polymerase [Paracoccaceae bacterium]
MIIQAALDYAERGWAVFSTHSIRHGQCTCGKASCNASGKHPIHLGGFKNASTDPAKIAGMFAQSHPVNVAIPTGARSGIFVLDIDVRPDKDGLAAFQALEAANGELNKSFLVRTGSGGFHIYQTTHGRAVLSSAGKIAPGIDVRGDGGYVIAPPSMHVSGNIYSWIK